MRSFQRPPVTPPTLAAKGVGGRARGRHRKKFAEDGTLPSSFTGHWTRPDVRGALLAMQGPVCGYCSADLSESAVDVEHFRPKSGVAEDKAHGGYWWLAYEFHNYLLSCTICNQKRKIDSFPLRPGGAYARFADGQPGLDNEPRTLIDPASDPVETWVEVDAADALAPLRAAPAAPDPARIGDAIDFFGLNQNVQQVKRRLALLVKAAEAIANGQPEQVADEAIRYRPQSLLCWQLLDRNAAQVLPDARRELEWLLGRLCADLMLKLKLIQAKSTKLDDNERDELIWALAVLWKHPPTGNPADVEAFLDQPGPNALKPLVSQNRALLGP